jgi:hypothetical protein
MKKTLFSLVLCLLFFNAQAQDKNARIGIKGGLNFATISVDEDNPINVDKNKIISTFQVGLFADVPLASILYFQPALTLSGKGAKYDIIDVSDNNNLTVKLNPYYLDLQTNLLLKFPVTESTKVFIGAGPYAAAGLFGKASIKGKFMGVTVDEDFDINYTNNKSDVSSSNYTGYANIKRFDFGGNLVAGVEFGRLVLSANYVHGLVNIQSGTTNDDNDFGKTRSFNMTIGYLF